MKNEKKVSYKDIGHVIYRNNRRAKNISIRINSEGIVKVTVPGWCTFHRAESFVLQKRKWIIQKLLSIERKIEENLIWKPGDIIKIRSSDILILQGEGSSFKIDVQNGIYQLSVPEDFMQNNAGYKDELKNHIAAIGLREAKLQLPSLLEKYSVQSNLSYERVSVRRMKTRWGSCSSKNNISLNSALIFLDDEIIEYVCLHELAHTVHKNHSQSFWSFLVRLLPDALNRRKELREMTIIA